VEREEQREKLRPDALTAWTDYQTTGLHLTAEEADAWLARSRQACCDPEMPRLKWSHAALWMCPVFTIF
jgi:hypothetical protein